jgi:hypothetical protein
VVDAAPSHPSDRDGRVNLIERQRDPQRERSGLGRAAPGTLDVPSPSLLSFDLRFHAAWCRCLAPKAAESRETSGVQRRKHR